MDASRRSLTVLLGYLLLASGCPDDAADANTYSGPSSDAGSTTADAAAAHGSGVDPTTPLSAASADQAERVCKYVEALGSIEGECTRDALEGASDTNDCRARRDNCIDRMQAQDSSDGCDPQEITKQLQSCSMVNVGELESCFSELARWQDDLQCSSAGQPLAYPVCMVAITQTCPALFEDEADQQPDAGAETAGHCPSGDAAAGGAADCAAFCDALIAPQCDGAPTRQQCLDLCAPIKRDCAPEFGALVNCLHDHDASFTCGAGGGLDATDPCSAALGCFADCTEPIVN